MSSIVFKSAKQHAIAIQKRSIKAIDLLEAYFEQIDKFNPEINAVIWQDRKAAKEIAKRSRGTPRILNNLLRRVRDFAEVEGNGKITHDISIKSLDALKIDKKGLDEMDNKIIDAIVNKFNGGPVGIN